MAFSLKPVTEVNILPVFLSVNLCSTSSKVTVFAKFCSIFLT
nr:MAG TPA: hypothetical protein [Caudoviricetes sp.]